MEKMSILIWHTLYTIIIYNITKYRFTTGNTILIVTFRYNICRNNV